MIGTSVRSASERAAGKVLLLAERLLDHRAILDLRPRGLDHRLVRLAAAHRHQHALDDDLADHRLIEIIASGADPLVHARAP
jgi:hypothetical protein